jgi:hypothetical protein
MHEIWVCLDCMLAQETDEQIDGAWSRLPDSGTHVACNFDMHEGRGMHDYKSTPCEGCGSKLAGQRFSYTFSEVPA